MTIHHALPLLLLALPSSPRAQMLLIVPGLEDPAELRFNERFIAEHRIATLAGQEMVKRDNEPMRKRNEKHLYRFDEQGRLLYSNHSFGNPGSGRDTASTTFVYDEGGHLRLKVRSDAGGRFTHETERDERGRPVRETYARVEDRGTDRHSLEPGMVTGIGDERFTYQVLNDSTSRKTYINSLDLPYREQTTTHDAQGRPRAIEDRYLVNNRRSRVRFAYDGQGRLVERIEQPDLALPRTIRRAWLYDAVGNVSAGDLWHDERHVQREEFVHDERGGILKARLTRDTESGSILVVRFTVETR